MVMPAQVYDAWDSIDVDIFDPKLYEACRRPMAEAETMPPWCYTSDAFYRREVATIFMKIWNFVGRTEQVPNPGDYTSFDFASVPVVILRDRDGEVRAFANTCRHRGAQLLEGDGNCRAIQCPYHGWTYALDGSLTGAPDMEETKGFDRTEFGLTPVRLEVWAGFMFINFDPDAGPLKDFIGDLDGMLASHEMEGMVTTRRVVFPIDCNWKVFVENAMEAYHIPMVHGGSISKHKAKKKRESSQAVDGEFVYLYTEQAGSRALIPGDTGFPEIENLDAKAAAGSYYPLIYPSTMFCCTADCMWYLEVHPKGAHKMDLVHGAVFPKKTVERDDFDEVVKKYYGRWDQTALEDNTISEIQQRGLNSPLARPGRLSYMEPLVHTIDNWVLDRVLGEDTPAGRGIRD